MPILILGHFTQPTLPALIVLLAKHVVVVTGKTPFTPRRSRHGVKVGKVGGMEWKDDVNGGEGLENVFLLVGDILVS